jgi:hypothetical protein
LVLIMVFDWDRPGPVPRVTPVCRTNCLHPLAERQAIMSRKKTGLFRPVPGCAPLTFETVYERAADCRAGRRRRFMGSTADNGTYREHGYGDESKRTKCRAHRTVNCNTEPHSSGTRKNPCKPHGVPQKLYHGGSQF